MKKLNIINIIKILPTIIIGGYLIYVVSSWIWDAGKTPVDNIGPTIDVTMVTGVKIDNTEINTGSIMAPNYGIDEVYYILQNGKPSIDYSVIQLNKQQTKQGSQEELLNFLGNNMFSVKMPKDIVGGYLYILLKSPLTYMSSIGAYQPITLKTNIYVNNWSVYGRLDTTETLPVKINTKEFLYDLGGVTIKTAKSSIGNRLSMKGKTIQIGGVVSDTRGNYIEKIVFIWKR